jgi:hypothetical protein
LIINKTNKQITKTAKQKVMRRNRKKGGESDKNKPTNKKQQE